MDGEDFVSALLCIISILVCLGLIATSIYCFIAYGDLPITDVPSWALLFMFGGRR